MREIDRLIPVSDNNWKHPIIKDGIFWIAGALSLEEINSKYIVSLFFYGNDKDGDILKLVFLHQDANLADLQFQRWHLWLLSLSAITKKTLLFLGFTDVNTPKQNPELN